MKFWIDETPLSLDVLQQGLAHLHFRGMDDGDIYVQRLRSESWGMSEGKVKTADYSASGGVGVRAIIGEQTGFAHADGFAPESLFEACRSVRAIGRSSESVQEYQVAARELLVPALYGDKDPLATLSAQEKVALLSAVDAYARTSDSRVVDVSASFSASFEEVFVLRLDGTFACDVRPLLRFNVSVVLEENGRRESGYAGGGARDTYAIFPLEALKAYVDDALEQARINLQAEAAPAGMMPVVLGAGWPGILLHEAVGHGLEGDFNRKGTSVFSGRIGERVCSPLCTVVDDGTLAGRRGSLSVDDEGTPTAKNVLIENGILRGYMQDRLNARLMGMAPTGNGRRESYAHLPMPRMTNTYLAPGEDAPEDMVKSVKKGIYAQQFGGGQVDIANGQFVFAATQAFMIEDGKITRPLKGVTLIGNGPDVMQRVSMVGHDFALDPGIGVCGKQGQGVPVGVGQPSVKIDEITVGGTAL
ncbi:MAG: metalloprotease TldD [Cardiobacteriaceae bacterium]|nr:metalloprotease TldD [Cardiobacteriaceae bacterium]